MCEAGLSFTGNHALCASAFTRELVLASPSSSKYRKFSASRLHGFCSRFFYVAKKNKHTYPLQPVVFCARNNELSALASILDCTLDPLCL